MKIIFQTAKAEEIDKLKQILVFNEKRFQRIEAAMDKLAAGFHIEWSNEKGNWIKRVETERPQDTNGER